MSNTLDDRIAELETRVAFQEHTLGELNDTVYAQQRKIDELELALKDALSRLRQVSGDGAGSDDATEKPPHY